MKYGYVRVSTMHQNTIRQEVLMRELGVDEMFIDKASGKNMDRPAYHEMMRKLKSGDEVVVESYSRMSRSVGDLLETVARLNEMGVGFRSKKENLDTTTATGRLFLTFIAGMNAFEREVMLERQKEGIAAAGGGREEGKRSEREGVRQAGVRGSGDGGDEGPGPGRGDNRYRGMQGIRDTEE